MLSFVTQPPKLSLHDTVSVANLPSLFRWARRQENHASKNNGRTTMTMAAKPNARRSKRLVARLRSLRTRCGTRIHKRDSTQVKRTRQFAVSTVFRLPVPSSPPFPPIFLPWERRVRAHVDECCYLMTEHVRQI
jgi:hypothetical protein